MEILSEGFKNTQLEKLGTNIKKMTQISEGPINICNAVIPYQIKIIAKSFAVVLAAKEE